MRYLALCLLFAGSACTNSVTVEGSDPGAGGSDPVGTVTTSTGVTTTTTSGGNPTGGGPGNPTTTGGGPMPPPGPPPFETDQDKPPPPDDPNDPCDILPGPGCEEPAMEVVLGPQGAQKQLHVVGVYESHGQHGGGCNPTGPFTVSVTTPGTHVMVLSSYEPVFWQVTAQNGATIERVIIDGYNEAFWDVPPGTIVEEWTYEGSGQYIDGGAYTFGQASTLIAYAEAKTGATFTSYQGGYCMSNAAIN